MEGEERQGGQRTEALVDGRDQQHTHTHTLAKVRLKVTVSTKKYVMVTMMMMMVIDEQNQWKWMKVTNVIIFNRFRASLLPLICVS